MKNKLLFIPILAFLLLFPANTFAQEYTSVASASIKNTVYEHDTEYASRVKILKGYLEKYNSPLAPFAEDFVIQAEKHDLDWRLVVAIAGVESTYGKAIPPYSNNAWGWGVYGENVIRFTTWSEGIETISKGLREKYINEWGGESIYEIGSIYAASPHWANSVNIHLSMIQKYALSDTGNTLSLSF
ncbi:MAG: hypothetical protein COU25_02085 [Candidatus Levybacteria bacterium CG10_big_fil_rev_8_21_14_0_10_35_13]|nr:MAG: hypothetical protein COU25_02085 [Candidatus Levybacteria bacterium CG10_big_fil_rev_8_21_14_0_10_35_13]